MRAGHRGTKGNARFSQGVIILKRSEPPGERVRSSRALKYLPNEHHGSQRSKHLGDFDRTGIITQYLTLAGVASGIRTLVLSRDTLSLQYRPTTLYPPLMH
jgi:hypothetical protein